MCLAWTNASAEAFLVQVDVALHPAGGGGEGDEGLTWCCREPSAGSVAEPLPMDGCLPFWLQGWECGPARTARPPPGDTREQAVGAGGVSTEAGAEESLSAGWKGLSEVRQDLSSLHLNRLPAVMEGVMDGVAERRQGKPFCDPLQSEDEVEP